MKTHPLLLIFCLICFQGNTKNADGNINFIAPGIYQLAYPNQLININFDPKNYSSHQGLFFTTELPESQRYEIVKILKQLIDLLPLDIIDNYLNIDILPGEIKDDELFGFSHKYRIMIDIVKTKAGMSYTQSIRCALGHEMGNMIFQQNSMTESAASLRAYLNEFYLDHHYLLQRGGNIYDHGYVSGEAAGISQNGYTVSNEVAELFAHFTCPESNSRIKEFIVIQPESILTEKIKHFTNFLKSISPGFDDKYFFGGSLLTVQNANEMPQFQYEDQMLALHELKSNETFDFSKTNDLPDLEASNYTEPVTLYEPDRTDHEEFYFRPDFEEDQVETVFDRYGDKKDKKQTKKAKKKRNGSGLLLVGSLIYLTLELLSQ